MYSNQLKIGMTLYCDDGYSTVELLDIQNDNTILVRYKGKQYRRDISIIGKRLFINPVNPKKTNVVRQERNSTPIQPTKVESSDTSRVIKTSIQPDNSKTYDLNGYDKEGYDKNGYNAEGYNKQGFDRYGFDKHGFDSYGYDKKGFNANGYNRLGFDAHGYNSDGFDATGFDRKGYNRLGYVSFTRALNELYVVD